MTANEILETLVEARRGNLTAVQFLQPDYLRDLCDPQLLPDIKPATARLRKARERNEKVCVYGDYDIDGLTATTLLLEAFGHWGIQGEAYIPSRFTEGYGLNKLAVKSIAASGATLIVTVDCGSLSVDEVDYANKLGVDVIITDHHSIGATLPKAVAVINPKRQDSQYPHHDLAGVGVAFKLVQALQLELPGLDAGQEKWLLDLVALGTVCDLVPLVGENRALVHFGLLVARQGRRPGLVALGEVAGCNLAQLKSEDFGFRLGPRLNASGRLGTAETSLKLLRSKSLPEARILAQELDANNCERRRLQDAITTAVLQKAKNDPSDVLVLADAEWSHGIVGIVAAKVMRQLRRPTLIMQINGEQAKGSARSFGEYDLSQAWEKVRPLLIAGGGHAYAAGCTVKTSDIEQLKTLLNEHFARLSLTNHGALLTPHVDAAIEDATVLGMELAELISALEPFGQGNPQPIFAIPRLEVTQQIPMGKQGLHSRLLARQSYKQLPDIVCFNLAGQITDLLNQTKQFTALVNLSINSYQGRVSPQLQLVDWLT